MPSEQPFDAWVAPPRFALLALTAELRGVRIDPRAERAYVDLNEDASSPSA